MKISVKLLLAKPQEIGSFLLIVLFLSISTSQLFHTHIDKHLDRDVQFEDRAQLLDVDKCAICDYYHHIQGQQILMPDPILLSIIYPKAITLSTLMLFGNHHFTPQVIANKGPPSKS